MDTALVFVFFEEEQEEQEEEEQEQESCILEVRIHRMGGL